MVKRKKASRRGPTEPARKKRTYTRRKRTGAIEASPLTPAQRVDFFDDSVMEIIKYKLSVAASVDQYSNNAHDCAFKGEIISRRLDINRESEIMVHWRPENVLPDEWMPECKFTEIKLVPLRRIPSGKIRVLYPMLFPAERQGKAPRKWKARPTSTPQVLQQPIIISSSSPDASSASSPLSSPGTSSAPSRSSSLGASSASSLSPTGTLPLKDLGNIIASGPEDGNRRPLSAF